VDLSSVCQPDTVFTNLEPSFWAASLISLGVFAALNLASRLLSLSTLPERLYLYASFTDKSSV